jgi:hypothetical protein
VGGVWRGRLVGTEELFFEIVSGLLEVVCDFSKLAGHGGKSLAAEKDQDGRKNEEHFSRANIAEDRKHRHTEAHSGIDPIMDSVNKKAPVFWPGLLETREGVIISSQRIQRGG